MGLDWLETSVIGVLADDGKSLSFRFTGTARAREAGSSAELFGGGIALAGAASGEGWHIALNQRDGKPVLELVADAPGDFPVSLDFEVPVTRSGDWHSMDFRIIAGAVVPLSLRNLPDGVSFNRDLPVVPEHDGGDWRGLVPANGEAKLSWRVQEAIGEGALFFSSSETSDIRVGSGLLRQSTRIDLRVLQGKLTNLSLEIEGPGEVLSVTGQGVIGWSVREEGGERLLDVRLNRPLDGDSELVIESQAALGGFPVKTEAVRLSPVGALRHSGWLRVANDGAVRLEVSESTGLIQLAPEQFPVALDKPTRQVFVYRFPSAERGFVISADQVLPEISVSEVTVYELAETDRRVFSDIELDIREAPLREWEMEIPDGYAVASLTGAEVADYVLAGEVVDGSRRLKILFGNTVIGRQLVTLRLEKNEAAKAGDWQLPPLGFPAVKSRRGYIGAVAAAGYRLAPGPMSGVAEVPVTFFPNKTPGLQQAFRLREETWKVRIAVEALGQRVQADVFHLYSLKAGAVYGSVLVNYFVIGAPATEWRISVPEGIGNMDVTGQNVGRDWRREENTVIIPLSRPVMGAGTVLLSFEQPMSARGGTIRPGEVRPLDVQDERGYVQVVSPLQVNHEVVASDGPLLALDPSELPAEFRLLSSAPTLGVWQYTGRDFNIGMKIEWFEQGETVDQLVDFIKLSSQVSRDGQWVTDARLFVKSKSRGVLRLTLPKEAVLWDARVGGEPVNARADAGVTLLPMPPTTDPNEAVEVVLRYGAKSKSASKASLAAPVLEAPVVIGEWLVTGDEGRRLIPHGGTADLIRPVAAESAAAWAWRYRGIGGGLLFVALVTIAMGASRPCGWRLFVTCLGGLAISGIALIAAAISFTTAHGHAATLEYAAPVVAAGSVVAVDVWNAAPWQAAMGSGVWLILAAAVILAGYGFVRNQPWLRLAGVALLVAGLSLLRGVAPWFFLWSALAAAAWWLPRFWQWIVEIRKPKPVVTQAAMVLLGGLFLAPPADAADFKAAESMIQTWEIREGRLHGEIDLQVRAKPGERFLLLSEPAVLGGFEGAGMRVVKGPHADKAAYFVIADEAGLLTAKASFEMPLADPSAGWTVPTGPAAVRRIDVRWKESGWEFFSQHAARITTPAGLAGDVSGAVLLLGPADSVRIAARPKQRDVAAEETRFFAEVANLFLPGPGVVNGRHQVSLRLSQGRVAMVTLKVPEGFTVGDVGEGPVGSWRFDPASRELRVDLEAAQQQAFSFTVATQRGAGALPLDLDLAPLRVVGAAGEVGTLALAFGDDAQSESIVVDGLSRVNPEDFDAAMLPRDAEGNALVTLQHVFRYGSGEASAKVKVTPVAPELRAETSLLVSLGEDRLVVAADIDVNITRSGIFRLVLDVPEGLEIESATGDSLSHWTESLADGKRLVTLHLAGRTLGQRRFSLTLTGPPVGALASWSVPRISLREASRETGTLTVVPERGLQVRAVKRGNVSQIDPRELADRTDESARAAARPGALAYRLLQADWSLALAISQLDPWVTARILHEVTLREGQVLNRVQIACRIENAAVKTLRVKIPGLDEDAADTVRATGPAVADLIPLEGEEGMWDIRFQRGVAGETNIDLEYQRRGGDDGSETIAVLSAEQIRQVSYFVAVRAGGRLELESGTLPRGWQRADWTVVQSAIGQSASGGAPALSFRVADPEGPLPVSLKRHDLANLRKIRVSDGSLTTLLSPAGVALTAVDLRLEVTGKGTLRMALPEGSDLFNVLVNDEGAPLVREGGDWLFHVFPSPETGRPSSVRFVYSSPSAKGKLTGPVLDVPMENLEWRVLVPEGWRLDKHKGDFDLKQQSSLGSFRLEDYQSFVIEKRGNDARSAVALLDQANAWLSQGDQEKAGLALSNAARNSVLDEASNEDARVQLRQLKTQQAVLGLNTRRQRVTLDNRADAPGAANPQLERAAQANPVLRGDYNYDPRLFERFLEGNTADENTALKEIANRIVTQQLAAEPAPVSLEVTLPERGTVLSFHRSVQIEGDKPMSITLDLEKSGKSPFIPALLIGFIAAGLVGVRGKLRI